MTTRTHTHSQGYQSDDEYTLKKYKQSYSKEDFKEIYCINQNAVDKLEKSRSTGFLFLGCLSSYQESPCRRGHHHISTTTNESSSSIFTSCIEPRQQPPPHPHHTHQQYRATSEEELRPPPTRYVYYYHEPLYSQSSHGSSQSCVVRGDRPRSVELGGSQGGGGGAGGGVSRESLYNEARKWVWSEQLDRYIETPSAFPSQNPAYPAKKLASRYPSAPLNASAQIKHVSFYSPDYFTRSATSNSFDEHKIRRARFELMNGGVSQERLIDGRCKTPENLTPKPSSSLVGSRTSLSLCVKSQATQTDSFIVPRAGGPSEYLSLSPRMAQRSRMVSQPTQTNGLLPPPAAVQATITQETQQFSQKPHPQLPTPPVTTAMTTPNIHHQPPPPQPPQPLPPPPQETNFPSPTTEEEFHENLLQLFSPTGTTPSTTAPTTVVSRSPSNKSMKSTSPMDETSSEGSYSLDKFKINNIPLPGSPTTSLLVGEVSMEIIKPPEGFGDVLQECGGGYRKKNKKKSIRAKSEERYAAYKTDASTQSSISLHASLHDLSTLDDDDCGIYLEPYSSGVWVYISNEEEVNCWNRHEPLGRVDSGESTEGEREFCKKFVALTHRMVHRRASGECYRRLGGRELEINKRTSLHRTDSEYGFRIHGSRPVVVSAVESMSPAESAGLEVGDVIMSINGLQVLDSSHSDVVRIASGAESLELELARTKNVVMETELKMEESVVLRGVLGKFNGMDLESEVGRGRGVWVERLFTLTPTTLSYSKTTPPSSPPLKILSLHQPHPLTLTLNSNSILSLSRPSSAAPLLLLTSSSPETIENWKVAMETVINSGETDSWLINSGRMVALVGSEKIVNSDCSGWVWKLGRRVKAWGRRWVVLKDAVLYFFWREGGEAAFGATHLHGYRVQTVSILGGKRHAFELLPPEASMRHYYLAVDTENERKRWLAALEYSIDRWIDLSLSNNMRKF